MKTRFVFLLFVLSILTITCDSNKEKTIKYKNTNYYAIGKVAQKSFVENSTVTFLSKDNSDTIISGKYYTYKNVSYINGVYKNTKSDNIIIEHGIFSVSNNSITAGLTSERKNASAIIVEVSNIKRYEDIGNNKHIIIEKISNKEYKLTIISDESQSNLIKFEAPVPDSIIAKYGFEAYDKIANICTKNVRCTYRNGMVFKGNLKSNVFDNDDLSIANEEGEITFSKGNISKVSIHRFDETCYLCTIDYLYNKNNYTKEEFYIDNKTIEQYGFWNFGYYRPDVRQCFFKNGNVFTGKVKYDINEGTGEWTNYSLKYGMMYYASGDIYIGDLDDKWACGIPVSGTMTFADGREEEGNWVDKFRLSENEIIKISELDSPTEKRDFAERCYYEIREASMENINNINHAQVNKNLSYYSDYFNKQFVYYVFNSQNNSFAYLQREHDYEDFTIYYGWFSDQTIVLDNTFHSYFLWDINTDVSRPLLRTVNSLLYGKLQQNPKTMFNEQDYFDDYLTFLRCCENFIRQDMNKHNGKFEESFCANLWKQRLYTMISREEYEQNYEIGLSYNMFLKYASVAMINDILVKLSRERDSLNDSDYVYKRD